MQSGVYFLQICSLVPRGEPGYEANRYCIMTTECNADVHVVSKLKQAVIVKDTNC